MVYLLWMKFLTPFNRRVGGLIQIQFYMGKSACMDGLDASVVDTLIFSLRMYLIATSKVFINMFDLLHQRIQHIQIDTKTHQNNSIFFFRSYHRAITEITSNIYEQMSDSFTEKAQMPPGAMPHLFWNGARYL